MKRLTKPTIRSKIGGELPNLDNYHCNCAPSAHWEMFRIARYSHYINKENGAIRFGVEVVARAYNQLAQYEAGSFRSGKYINHFINFVLPQGMAQLVKDDQGREWSTATWEEVEQEDGSSRFKKVADGKQREVIFNWTPELLAIFDEEDKGLYSHEPDVYISNGLRKNAAQEIQERKNKISECANQINILDCEPAKYIGCYMNSLPINGFTRIAQNIQSARDEVAKIKNPHVRRQQTLILDAIEESPKPVYKPTANTDRLFGYGANITNLKKNVRKVLTAGWIEADLENAQLAIISKIWNIPELKSYLEQGKSLRKDLTSYLHLDSIKDEDRKDEIKGLIKDRIYGLVFGTSQDRILNGKESENDPGFTKDMERFGITNAGQKFLDHPLVKLILKARGQYQKQVLHAGYLLDAFGKVHSVNRKNLLSKIARQAQSWEMAIIYSIYELTNETDAFTIQCYQFDGVSLKFHDEERKQYWIDRIKDAVTQRAKMFDIPTALAFEENQAPSLVNENIYKIMAIQDEKYVQKQEVHPSANFMDTKIFGEFLGSPADINSLSREKIRLMSDNMLQLINDYIRFNAKVVNNSNISWSIIELLTSESIARSMGLLNKVD